MIDLSLENARGRLAACALVVTASFAAAVPASAQEVALVHEAGDRIRVAGMPVREFASGLRMESRSGEEGAFPDICFVALVDSEGNVWEEYVSEPFDSRDGSLEGACVPRFPVLPTGYLPESSVLVPFVEGVGAEAFFGGVVDWQFIMKRVDQSAPDVERAFIKIGDIKGESVQPPAHMEGVEYDWVALFFMVGPSEDLVGMNVGLQFSTRPIMIMVGAS